MKAHNVDSPATHPRYDLPLSSASDHNLGSEEVRILWDFVHGDIMDSNTRRRLVEHWGMCERHAWAYALVEIELWHAGAGKRGGHQPFDVSILYTDLAARMHDQLRHTRRRGRVRMLTGKGSCVVCDDLRGPDPTGIVVTHAGLDLPTLTAEANRMDHIRNWMVETQPVWSELVCPACAMEMDFPASSLNQQCRLHLISSTDVDDAASFAAFGTLGDLSQQLHALTDSMTQSGAPSTPVVDASWVRAMAWFHSWRFPLRMIAGQ